LSKVSVTLAAPTGRRDALPAVPERMAVRLARHVFLYLKTRCEREGRL